MSKMMTKEEFENTYSYFFTVNKAFLLVLEKLSKRRLAKLIRDIGCELHERHDAIDTFIATCEIFQKHEPSERCKSCPFGKWCGLCRAEEGEQ